MLPEFGAMHPRRDTRRIRMRVGWPTTHWLRAEFGTSRRTPRKRRSRIARTGIQRSAELAEPSVLPFVADHWNHQEVASAGCRDVEHAHRLLTVAAQFFLITVQQ